MTDVFPSNSVGIVTARDKLTIQWTRDEMKQVTSDFARLSEDAARAEFDLGRDAQDWKVQWAQEDVRRHSNADKHIQPILYRPFDERYTYYTGKASGFICRPREKVMHHMLAGPNVGLVTTRQCQRDWSVSVSNTIIGHKALTTYDISSLFPLYIYPSEGQERLGLQRQPNISEEFVESASSSLGLNFIADGSDDLQTSFGPDEVVHYI